MPKLYNFPVIKCSENENFRNLSLAGCAYVPKVPDFKPHRNSYKLDNAKNLPKLEGPKPPSFAKPTAPTATANPTTNPTTIDQIPFALKLTQTLNQYGLGHLYKNDDDDDDNKTPLWSKVVKQTVKDAKKAGVDNYVKYSELTPTEVDAAKMTKVSYINLTEGQNAANAYANEQLKNWKLDTSLSDEHTSVFVSKEGKVAIAYRGTQAARDWKTNIKLGLGQEESSQQMKEVEATYKNIVKKYGKEQIEFFTGHSKGGGQAIVMGNKHGISTITQDPAITPKMIATSNSAVHHVVNRTPTDYVSGLASTATALKDNFSTRLIQPSKGTGILGSHDVDLMTLFDYQPVAGKGNTDYDEKTQIAKDKAFIAKHIEAGMSFEDIEKKIGYKVGTEDYETFKKQFEEVSKNPSYTEYYKDAGYNTNEPTNLFDKAKAAATTSAAGAVEKATSKPTTAAITLFNRSTGANLVSSIGAAYALQGLGADDETAAIVGGGVGNVIGEKVGQRAGMGTMIGGKNISIRNAGASGVISSVVGSVSQDAAYQHLTELGLDHNSATVISSTAGGAAQGAAEYQANVAIAYVEKQYGRGVLSAAVRSAIAQGVEKVGFTEALSAIAGRTGSFAMRGRWGGWWGTLLGAGIGLGMGAFEVATHQAEKEVYALLPSAFEGPDQAVGTDTEIIQIMKTFNEQGDFSERKQEEVNAQLIARMNVMRDSGVLGMVLPIKLQRVPEHLINQDEYIILPGEYNERNIEEYKNNLEQQTIAENSISPEDQAKIDAMPVAAYGTLLINTIENDKQYQEIIQNGTYQELNQRIREIITENKNNSHTFADVIDGFDTYPQLDETGNWTTKKWKEEQSDVWRDEPHPNTANEHTPPSNKEVEVGLA
jgi:hypothetical protein